MKQFKKSLITVVISTLVFQGANWWFLNAFYNPVPEITWVSWLLCLAMSIFYETVEVIRELPEYKIVREDGDMDIQEWGYSWKVWYVIKKKSFLWFYHTYSRHDEEKLAKTILENLKNETHSNSKSQKE